MLQNAVDTFYALEYTEYTFAKGIQTDAQTEEMKEAFIHCFVHFGRFFFAFRHLVLVSCMLGI